MHILVKQQRRNIANLRGHVTKMLTLLSALSARPLSAVNLLHCGWVNFQLKVEGPVHTLRALSRVAADALPRHLALLRDNARCCETTRDNARRALSCDNARQSRWNQTKFNFKQWRCGDTRCLTIWEQRRRNNVFNYIIAARFHATTSVVARQHPMPEYALTRDTAA